jgi:AcrR family transcriptional regulator
MAKTAEGRSTKGAETRQRLLDAARQVLAEDGVDNFTTRRVAQAAGVSHGMCHYHFANKDDLVAALIESARQDWVTPLRRLVEGEGSAEARARAVISWMAEPATIEVMRVHSALFWFALRNDDIRDALAIEYGAWRALFVQLFKDLAKERNLDGFDADRVGQAFASTADALVQQQVLEPELATEEILSVLLGRLIG